MIDDKSLSELIELGEKATPRPWEYDPEEMQMLPAPSSRFEIGGREGWCGEAAGGDDGRFITSAANLAIPLALEVRRLMEENERLSDQKDGAYRERDALVCALSKLFPAWIGRHPESDTSWDNDWRWIVFVDAPSGQMSWHIHDSERSMFDHLEWIEDDEHKWDGHTTEEKYRRLENIDAE